MASAQDLSGGSKDEDRMDTPKTEDEDPLNQIPDRILYRKNPDEDDMGYKAVVESLTNPQSYLNFRSALRTVVFVSFPMFTIGVHPNTMFKTGFIAMLIAAVLGTSTCRNTLGEQIGLHTWTWRGILYMFIISEAAIALKLEWHPHHWWGMIAAGIFLASFTSDANVRRFMYLYFFLFMMEIREFVLFIPMLPENNGRWLAANFLIGTVLGIASNLLPYPTTLAAIIQKLADKLFGAVAKNIYMMHKMVWGDDMHAACLFFADKTIFDTVEHWLGLMPTLLWFTNWEPLEFALRNPIRRLKFSFLRRILSLVYAAFSAGNTLVKLRREQSDRIALQKVRVAMWEKAFGVQIPSIGGSPASSGPKSGAEARFFQQLVRQYGEGKAIEIHEQMWTLHQNSKEHSTHLAKVVMEAIIAIAAAPCTPKGLLEKVDFDGVWKADIEMRRNLRLEVLQSMRRQRELIMKRREEQKGGTPVAFGSPFSKQALDTLTEYQRLIDDTEVFIRLNTIFFHMLLSMIAGEVFSFGEQMKDYKPAKSLCRRLLDHFIVEPWKDFWEEVWCHLTLARPADWRILKDAIKITCAYLSACALNFEMYMMPGGMYYFGTTILLGLPVEEESLSLGVNRLAGNALGCSLGFLAYNNFSLLQQQIGMALFMMFLCQLFKNHPTYGQTFFYGSIMVIGGVATSLVPIDLLTRLIASSYTVCAYLLCCLLIFPTSPMKILFGYRAKLFKLISEIIDQAALTAHLCLESDSDLPQGGLPYGNEQEADATTKEDEIVVYGRSGMLCSELSDQLALARRLLAMCTKWTPFAARQHVIRGMLPFPEVASKQVHQSMVRLLAELDLFVFGAQLLHRPRNGRPISKSFARLISGSMSDFLFDFSHACRSVLQDMIDSMQWSRKWNYELFLHRCARLSRLKVAAHAVMYECYVLIGDAASANVDTSFDDQTFKELRKEVRAAQQSSGMLNQTSVAPPPSVAERYLYERMQSMTQEEVQPMETETARGDTADNATGGDTRDGSDPDNSQQIRLSEMRNKSFHFTARLVQFSMNSHAASQFQSKDCEENRIDMEVTRHNMSRSAPHSPKNENPLEEQYRYNRHISPPLSPAPQGSTTTVPGATWLNFSYHEDSMDLAADTDFVALNAILGSCEGFIGEVESMCGAVNTMSEYQKQLHESSLILPVIDKLSAKLRAHVDRVYLERHYNLPLDELNAGGANNLQTDAYRAWSF